MPATTAPAAKAAILTLLQARPALASPVKVTWGGPTENEDTAEEHVHMGRVVGAGEWRTLGAGRRHESYTIELRVTVLKYGDDEQAVEDRSFDLLDEVSAALTTDPYLSGLLYEPAAIEAWEQSNVPMTDQWYSVVVAQIRCNAQFTP